MFLIEETWHSWQEYTYSEARESETTQMTEVELQVYFLINYQILFFQPNKNRSYREKKILAAYFFDHQGNFTSQNVWNVMGVEQLLIFTSH